MPTVAPTQVPTIAPTQIPTPYPTYPPTSMPTPIPSSLPTPGPTTAAPTPLPTSLPSPAPTLEPLDCPKGRYSDTVGYPGAGRYRAEENMTTVCFECPMGRYANQTRSGSCTKCPDGKQLLMVGAVNNTCEKCEVGKSSEYRTTAARFNFTNYSAAAPGPICFACELGSYAHEKGLAACAECPNVCHRKHTKGCEEGKCDANKGYCSRDNGLCWCKSNKYGMNINANGEIQRVYVAYDADEYDGETYTTCQDYNDLSVSFGSAIASLFIGVALFFYIVSPKGLGKYLRKVSMRMERPVSEISSEGVEEEEDEEDDDQAIILAQASDVGEGMGLREPQLRGQQDAGEQSSFSSFKAGRNPSVSSLKAGGKSSASSLKSAYAGGKSSVSSLNSASSGVLSSFWGWTKLCCSTLYHPVRKLGTCCWSLIPGWFLAQLQIEAPVDFVLLFAFPPIFCVGYLLFDVFTMLLDAFLIMNNLSIIEWVVPSFPTVDVVMADIDLSLFSFLQDVNFAFSIDVTFIATWWRNFAKVLGGIGNFVTSMMEGANVTCNGANRAVSYAGHVGLMAIMVLIIESNVGYAMRFSGAERFSKYILGSFHSSRATKLAAKGTKVAAGKLKVRSVA